MDETDPTLTRVASGSPVAGRIALPSIPGYELLSELGRGGMGVVYHARDVNADRDVAVKVILSAEFASADEHARFLTEARAVAAIQHPGVVTLYVVGEHAGRPYLCMEYCAGGSLRDRVRRGVMDSDEAAELVASLADAVQAAHDRRIVHRDLKPANILLTADGQPKITDFGLAKRLDGTQGLTASDALMGTPAYMSPEQAAGRVRDVTPATDIYSLGTILYELLTGGPAFRGNSPVDVLHRILNDDPAPPSRVRPGVPVALDLICLQCLSKRPVDRYASAAALAADLRHHLAGRRPAAAKVPARRRPRAALACAALAGGVLAGLAAWWTRPPRPDPAPFAGSAAADPSGATAPIPPPAHPPANPAAWVSLFNGTDLTGWATHPSQPGQWVVADGIITCAGPQTHLYSDKLYDRAHIRMEARIGRGVSSALLFRVKQGQWITGPAGRIPFGYQAAIIGGMNDDGTTTGTLLLLDFLDRSGVRRHRIDEWFVMEVRADGESVRAWVNGDLAASAPEHPDAPRRGHIVLSHAGPGSSLQIRKIDVKELPREVR